MQEFRTLLFRLAQREIVHEGHIFLIESTFVIIPYIAHISVERAYAPSGRIKIRLSRY